MTPQYEKLRNYVLANNATGCHGLNLPNIVCEVPFHGRSEFSPRANPAVTSIRSILHADVDVPKPKPNLYDPPDVRLVCVLLSSCSATLLFVLTQPLF